ncbi:MAG: Dabb family protein [Actinobacteria bacterium]|nr:Dabb family protein [Actinomycetota bacterium]
MITHVVSFRWKPETTAEQIALIKQALDTLPAAIADIVSYQCGPDVGAHGAANFDFAIVATFENIDGWRTYDAHPEHDRVRSETVRPWIAERAAVQFES